MIMAKRRNKQCFLMAVRRRQANLGFIDGSSMEEKLVFIECATEFIYELCLCSQSCSFPSSISGVSSRSWLLIFQYHK
jgi:hypothetical protein